MSLIYLVLLWVACLIYINVGIVRADVHVRPNPPEVIRLINNIRESLGVKALIPDSGLSTSSRIKANDLQKNDYFDHVDSNGVHGYEYISEQKKDCIYVGENLAYSPLGDSARVVSNFVNSPAHYAEMINARYDYIGVSVSPDGTKTVVHFCDVK